LGKKFQEFGSELPDEARLRNPLRQIPPYFVTLSVTRAYRRPESARIARWMTRARESAVRIDDAFVKYLIDRLLLEVGQQIAAQLIADRHHAGNCPDAVRH